MSQCLTEIKIVTNECIFKNQSQNSQGRYCFISNLNAWRWRFIRFEWLIHPMCIWGSSLVLLVPNSSVINFFFLSNELINARFSFLSRDFFFFRWEFLSDIFSVKFNQHQEVFKRFWATLSYFSLGTNGVLNPPPEEKALLPPWLKEVSQSVHLDGDSGTQIVCRKAYFPSRHLRRELNYRNRKGWIVHNFQLTCLSGMMIYGQRRIATLSGKAMTLERLSNLSDK